MVLYCYTYNSSVKYIIFTIYFIVVEVLSLSMEGVISLVAEKEVSGVEGNGGPYIPQTRVNACPNDSQGLGKAHSSFGSQSELMCDT